MDVSAPDHHDLTFHAGDHVCAFYNGGDLLNDIMANFASKALQTSDKCICFIDAPSPVMDRIPDDLRPQNDVLQFVSEEDGYLPGGHFSKETFMRNLESTVEGVLSSGYDRLWLVGNASVVVRKEVDLKAWFATESEVSDFAPRYPQFIMCLYDLDLYDGEMVMYVLKTHTKIFVNGLIITNPYYIPKQEFLADL